MTKAPAIPLAEEEVARGAPAPRFSLRTPEAETSSVEWLSDVEDARARLVRVRSFASWCAPRKDELPLFVQLDQACGEQGLCIVAVEIVEGEAAIRARRHPGEEAPPSLSLVRNDGTLARIDRGNVRSTVALLGAVVGAELGKR
jgi:hypothetical protein